MSRAARPRIGITTYQRELDQGRERFRLPSAYVDAVRGAGGLPLLLPPGETDPVAFLEVVDGLVLCGGGDMHPSRFGGEAHPAQFWVCEERDAFDVRLALAALERRTPLLAICRGMQVLNVALGGDLHVHLPEAVGESVPHRVSEDESSTHRVRLAADSHLARMHPTLEISVTSWHHQGIARVGEGLRPAAWADDGTVEALELPDRPEVLAVQWHPEMTHEDRLFEEFTERSRAFSSPLVDR